MVSASAVLAADTPAPQARALSLQECLGMALEKNLDLRIERYNPQLALFNLKAAYAGYEPNLNLSGQHSHTEAGSSVFQGGIVIPGSKTDADSFSGGLGGVAPWGLTYNLRGSASDQSGVTFRVDPATGQIVQAPFGNSQGQVAIDLSQPLLKNFWIDSTRLNIAVTKNRLKYSELGLQQRIIDVVTRVELAYYDLKYGYETVKVLQEALTLAQRLLDENKKRVAVGALAPLDEKQSEAQVSARQADLISGQRNLAVLDNALKQFLSDDFAAWHSVSLEPSESLAAEREFFDLQDSWSKGLTQRPDYLQAKLDLERLGVQLKWDRNQLYPQLDVFGTYGYNGSGLEFSGALGDLSSTDRPFFTYGGRIAIPLGNSSARNRYKSDKMLKEQSLLGLKKLEQDIMIQIDGAIKLAQANFERVGATRKASEYAEAALAAEQKKLENGKSTSFVVLQLQRDLTSARSDEINALVQYKRALASLAQAEGSALQRHKIDLTVK